MRSVQIEAAECRGSFKSNTEYRLVLYTFDGAHDTPKSKSRYEQGSSVVSWQTPFGGPILEEWGSSARISIGLREKKRSSGFRTMHGSDTVSFTLGIDRVYTSEAICLEADPNQLGLSLELVVTVTATGFPNITTVPHSPSEVADWLAVGATTSPQTTVPPSLMIPVVNSSLPADPTVNHVHPSPIQSDVRDVIFGANTSENLGISRSEQASASSPQAEEQAQLYPRIDKARVDVENAAIQKSEPPIQEVPLSHLAGNEATSGLADVSEATGDALTSLGILVDVLDKVAEIHPFVKTVWGVVKIAYDLKVQQSEHDDIVNELYEAMDSNCRLAVVLARNLLTSEVIAILRSILEAISEAASVAREYRGIRKTAFSSVKLAASSINSRVEACLKGLHALQRQLNNYTLASIQSDVQDIASLLSKDQRAVTEQLKRLDEDLMMRKGERLLGEMVYAPEADRALRSSHGGCLQETRAEIIEAIVDWATGSSLDRAQSYIRGLNRDSRVLWLCGVAGSGKSSIAISIARNLQSKERLGALYAFEAAYQDSLNPKNLFSTIARQRAKRHPDQEHALMRILEPLDSDQRATTSPSEQFRCFLALTATHNARDPNNVVIIDAFDESASIDNIDRRVALEMLSPSPDDAFPHHLRFIVTSRYDPDIARRLEPPTSSGPPVVSILRMEDIEPTHTRRDIKRYVEHALKDAYGLVDVAEKITELAMAAKESFQWASAACGYILGIDSDGGKSPAARLSQILLLGTSPNLDALYRTILDRHFAHSIKSESPALRLILGALMRSVEPASIRVIAGLARTDDHPSSEPVYTIEYSSIARRLASLVTGTDSTTSPLIPLHTSFVEFLQSYERSEGYAIPPSETDLHFALGSLRVMKRCLRFNICGLKTSFLPNKAVPHLAESIKEHIPDELSYACRFWPAHVAGALSSPPDEVERLLSSLRDFLNHKTILLNWLEVMSLICADALQALSPISFLQAEIRDLSDLITFTSYFAIPISTSVPHIYMSALAFTPLSSPVASVLAEFPNVVRPSIPLTTWPQMRHTWAHPSMVTCVAFSPNGKCVVSGSLSGEISFWDVYSGMLILPRIRGSEWVLSLAMSSDGTLLASGFSDGTIRLWDMRTMSPSGEPLRGHTDVVRSVLFSPDGTLLASCSHDKTVRLWDVNDHSLVGTPLRGHSNHVFCVSFSPDGALLASGGADTTVRLWDVRTRSAAGEPLIGHTHSVQCVTFSPDGTLLASASSTIRLWDVCTRLVLGEPLTAHAAPINSIAFSPDHKTLASCSDDQTVRFWDVYTRSLRGEPLTGHTGIVASIAFSPNGALLASGSLDMTVRIWSVPNLPPDPEHLAAQFEIRSFATFLSDGKLLASGSDGDAIQLWDVHSVSAVGEPLLRHTGSSRCAFSLDGTLIATASSDELVHLWDIRGGSPVGGPLKGSFGLVQAIAFSPDGTLLALGSDDQMIRLCDVHARSVVGEPLAGHSGEFGFIDFSPDGSTLASVSTKGTIRLWDVQSRSPIGHPPDGGSKTVSRVAFSPDGRLMAYPSVTSLWDDAILLWDVHAQAFGTPLRWPRPHAPLHSLSFSPDGALLAAGSAHNAVWVWDVHVPFEVALLQHESDVRSVTFSSVFPLLYSVTSGGVIRKWDLGSIPSTRSVRFDGLLSDPPRGGSSSPLLDHIDLSSLSPDFLLNLDDGWAVGPNHELILWIPPAIRASLFDLRETERFGGPPRVALDFSDFVCGTDWTKCTTLALSSSSQS